MTCNARTTGSIAVVVVPNADHVTRQFSNRFSG